MAEFYCLLCLFLLETAVICSYWYIFRVSLKSAPRYVNAMRPGRTITLSPWWKGPAEAVLPSPAEEDQPATGAIDTVLLCPHWIRPLHVNNCLVQLSYQIWPQKTTEGSPDCWANHWYNPPHSPRTHPEWAKKLAKSLWTPHIQHTSSLNCYRLVDTTELWAPERPDTGTVSSLKLSISWTLDIKHGTHSTIIQLFVHQTHLFFHFKFAHVRPHT